MMNQIASIMLALLFLELVKLCTNTCLRGQYCLGQLLGIEQGVDLAEMRPVTVLDLGCGLLEQRCGS